MPATMRAKYAKKAMFRAQTANTKCVRGSIAASAAIQSLTPVRIVRLLSEDKIFWLHHEYARPSFCHKCGRPYPWMEDRLQTAPELLYHDDKLTENDREQLWPLLMDVMSNPDDDLTPAKRKLTDIKLTKARQVTREIITDLVAKTIAEMFKP
jgi:hypothetical protein